MKMDKIDREHYELVTERLKNGKISGEILARYISCTGISTRKTL